DDVPGRRQLTLQQARDHILERGFGNGGPSLVGIEAEWLTVRPQEPAAPAPFDALHRALGTVDLPAASAITWEPGGQLELSTRPEPDAAGACAALEADLGVVRPAAAQLGCTLAAVGIDPLRPPLRVVDSPRYAAMEAFFDTDGDHGRRMMCSTAALQVNVGPGPAGSNE